MDSKIEFLPRKKAVRTRAIRSLQSSVAIEPLSTEAAAKIKDSLAKQTVKIDHETKEKIRKENADACIRQITQIEAEVAEKRKTYIEKIAKQFAEPRAEIANKQVDQYVISEARVVSGKVSAGIEKTAKPSGALPGKDKGVSSIISANDIMQTNVVWGNPDDSVEQTLLKMQQHDTSHVMIGQNGTLEAIVTKSDLTGAVSPYLRPQFSKWRRALDDVTLKIKVKWIMSRPVHTVNSEASLGVVIRNMYRLHVHALPVTDQNGKIIGLVTEADIFKTLLKPRTDCRRKS